MNMIDCQHMQTHCFEKLPFQNFSNSFQKSKTPDTDYLASSLIDTSSVNDEHDKSVLENLRKSKRKQQRNFVTAYRNINSIRYKFDEIRELLNDKIVDLLIEAKQNWVKVQRLRRFA